MKIALAPLIAGSLLVLLWSFSQDTATPALKAKPTQNADAVQLVGPRLIAVTPSSPLDKKLGIAGGEQTKDPSPGVERHGLYRGATPSRQWTRRGPLAFSSPDLLSAYTDWQKSRADVDFAEKQLVKIRELDTARITAQTKVVERLRKLVAAGTDSVKDLATEEATLVQTQLQGQKEVYEAETAVKIAARTRAALARNSSRQERILTYSDACLMARRSPWPTCLRPKSAAPAKGKRVPLGSTDCRDRFSPAG